MAETLSYNNTPENTTIENLSEEEQNSLEVGQQLQADQEQLLAGKYKNAEELEKAYVELQKKLGSSEEETEEEVTETTDEQAETSPSVSLITDASEEYAEKGELSPETLAKFSEMSSTDLVNAYMDMQGDNPSQVAADLSDEEVNSIKNSVGGENVYNSITDWAANNLDQKTIDGFDQIVNSGNAQAIQLAIAGIKSQMDEANGYEGRMLSGKPPKTSGDVFRSQQELVNAMSDPKYDNDPAYRMDVIQKLDRSDLQF
jgi:hypothetical protein